jgi:hypothetical protein
LAWSAQGEKGHGLGRGGGLAGPFRPLVGPVGSAALFFVFSFFYLFLSFKNAFGVPKLFRKMQMRYRWIPCEKSFTMEPTLKKNEIFYKTKFA